MNPGLHNDITYKKIWAVAYPIILGSVAQNLINVTDTAFLGRVGEIELGASALGGMFYFVLIMLAMGFGTGAQIIIARRFGEGDYKRIGKTFDHVFYFMVPLSLLSFAVLFFFSPAILKPLVDSQRIYEATVDYMDFRMYGIVFAFGQIMFRSFYVGIANTRIITWSTLVMAIVNVILDYVLIFGHFGFPEMGIQGAALASVIAEACALLYLWIYTISKENVRQFSLFSFVGFDRQLFYRNLKLAYPLMIQNFLGLSVWFAFFLLVEKMGEQELAISNIIRSIYIVLMIPVWGFSAAANSLVSFAIGMQRNDQVFKIMGRIILMSNGGVLFFIILSYLFPHQILSVYTNDVDLITKAIPVLYIVNFGAMAISAGFVMFNGMLGTGKTIIGLLIEILVLVLYLAYVYVIINQFNANVAQVWTSEMVYGGLLALFSWLYLRYGKWSGGVV
jgi:putative MATE family efflux protein